MDNIGDVYAAGHTYSTLYTRNDQDIVVFKIEPETLNFKKLEGWTLIWGGALTETATGIATDDTHVWVSGYTNSEPKISKGGKYDIILMKISKAGILISVKAFGMENNDKVHGLTAFKGNIFMVGESDSVGWTSQRTDMIFL